MNTELKKKLQAEIIWASTRSGAFQRSGIYAGKVTEENKAKFRKDTKGFLFTHIFLEYYKSAITEAKLKTLIETFINRNAGNTALQRKALRYGNAQKFVNLYLKGMWVLGYLKIPPHFPVDRIMMKRLKINENWTAMDEKKYASVIIKARDKVKGTSFKSIAEWEAEEYLKSYVENK